MCAADVAPQDFLVAIDGLTTLGMPMHQVASPSQSPPLSTLRYHPFVSEWLLLMGVFMFC